MALPEHEWLPMAKRLAVGAKLRVHHRSERRPNMVVGHDSTHYWSYCQACKEGGRVDKTHVRLVAIEPPRSRELSIPTDLVAVRETPDVLRAIAGYLARKHMDIEYLPALYFSKERMRVLLQAGSRGDWFGRDLTEKSSSKWLHYRKVEFVATQLLRHSTHSIIVEDIFSAYKIAWAFRGLQLDVYSSLGTRIHDSLLLELAQQNKPVVVMYDGDSAGYSGAEYECPRLRGIGLRTTRLDPPHGLDPKDLTIDQLRQRIGEALSTL